MPQTSRRCFLLLTAALAVTLRSDVAPASPVLASPEPAPPDPEVDPHFQLETLPPVAAFAMQSTVVQGDTLVLAVHSYRKRPLSCEVVYESPDGPHQVLSFSAKASPQPAQAIQTFEGRSYVSFAAWTPNVEVPIPADGTWPPGYYHLRVTDAPGHTALVPFVVESLSPPPEGAVCVVAPYLTTQVAYNRGGGASVYHGFDGAAYREDIKATAASVQRPQNLELSYGYLWQLRPVLRWLGMHDVPVRCTTDLALHHNPALLHGCQVVVLVYHVEYVSSRIRTALVDAVARGVHLLSFSSNSCYWKIELARDAAGHEVMLVNRYNEGNLWRHQIDAEGQRLSEQRLFGAQYIINAVGPTQPFALKPRPHALAAPMPDLMDHWIFEDTDLRFGDRISGLLSGEVDVLHTEHPLPDIQEQVVFIAPFISSRTGEAFPTHISWFRRPHGQMTFHSATHNFQHMFGNPHRKAIRLMMNNILSRMMDVPTSPV